MKLKNLGYFIYDIGLSPQRKLNNTTSLESLGDKLLNLNMLMKCEIILIIFQNIKVIFYFQ